MSTGQPNVLFIMTDQQRFDTIAALGNEHIYTPNFDRLVRRGVTFTRAYSSCPVCVPARYNVRTGAEPANMGWFMNGGGTDDDFRALREQWHGRYLGHVMRERGYRTFGVGKSHSYPWDEDLGYDVHLHSEELYGSPEERAGDAFARWIHDAHPQFDFIDMLQGERTEMYYMPQMSPLPAELTVESWAADRAIEQLQSSDARPWFGFVSFIGPHPPFAPPQPYNRIYDPDRMPLPVRGDIAVDHMDATIVETLHVVWIDEVTDLQYRILRSRYYGEITFIDACLGRILDAVEARPDSDNTIICFFSDHGDHLGDHHAWQKESFFEASCHVPLMVSWPAQLPRDTRCDALATLTDLFAVATLGEEVRDGVDLLAVVGGSAEPRDAVVGMYGDPGTRRFKIMIRRDDWKYIYMANGGREQLFNLADDPNELVNLTDVDVIDDLRRRAVDACRGPVVERALDGDDLRAFEYEPFEGGRIYQFDRSRGVTGFPEHPRDVLEREA